MRAIIKMNHCLKSKSQAVTLKHIMRISFWEATSIQQQFYIRHTQKNTWLQKHQKFVVVVMCWKNDVN